MKFKNLLALSLVAASSATVLAACGSSSDTSGTTTTADSGSATTASGSTTAAGGSSSDSAVPDVVNIGAQTLVTPELVARYEKIYEDYLGTKVNIVQCDSGADVNRAFAGKSVDIAMVGTSPAAIGISNDLGYEVIWYHDVIGAAESLVSTASSGISTVSDLKGKKVATPFASTAHYSLQNAMSLEGVSASDVELLDMQPDDIYAAWKRGDIDAAYVWNPVLGELKKDGGVTVTDSAQLADKGIITADLAVVSKEFAEKYPDVVTGFIKAQIYGLNLYENDKDKAIKEIAEAIGISEEDAASQVKDFIYPSAKDQITSEYLGTKDAKGNIVNTLKSAADFLVEQGSIEKAADKSAFEDSVTGEFIEKALESSN